MLFITLLGIASLLFHYINMIQSTSEIIESKDEQILFDFTKNSTTDDWTEKSDTVREVGMSKAILTSQKTDVFKRAILFTLLNPQKNGACFAGVRKLTKFNLEKFNYLSLKIRGQGQNFHYKIVLRHKNKNDEPNPSYEQFFEVPVNQFEIINLLFSKFKPYYRGKENPSAEPLDKSFITSIGIQVYGGVYLPYKQFGTSSLEIDWIKVL